jgi:pyridoxamine 5'-phosphate oxidase
MASAARFRMMAPMPDSWITSLKTAADAEKSPLVATLATVLTDPSGTTPEARSVIVRRVADDGTLTFTSDARSSKDGQMLNNPRVVLVLWLPGARHQFRVTGSARLQPVDSPERFLTWKQLSDTARAVFAWPPPATLRRPGESFPSRVRADVAPPDSFNVWTVTPDSVDSLDLRQHPHLRRRWSRREGGWSGEIINP